MLSIIIPAFNEEKLIEKTIRTTIDYLSNKFPDFEIIVIDDGSCDNTSNIVEQIVRIHSGNGVVRLIQNEENRGKGYSIKRGVFASQGDSIIFFDADLPYQLASIDQIVKELSENHADVMAGSRKIPEAKISGEVQYTRRVLSKIYQLIVKMLFALDVGDTQCGFKGFKRDAAIQIFAASTIERFGFDVEILTLARKMGYKIGEFPVSYNAIRSDSRIRFVKDSFLMLHDLLMVKRNMMTGKYKKKVKD